MKNVSSSILGEKKSSNFIFYYLKREKKRKFPHCFSVILLSFNETKKEKLFFCFQFFPSEAALKGIFRLDTLLFGQVAMKTERKMTQQIY